MARSDPFAKRVVLLTGATGGIGRALAERLAARRARLILTSRVLADLDALGARLPPSTDLTLLPADLSVHGRVDVLWNNAGLGYFALLEEARAESIRKLFEVNTFAPLALAKALLPSLKAKGRGRIVNVVTALGRAPVPSVGVYGASKTALAVLGNVLRLELEPSGVVVVNIYPGTVQTDFERNAEREAGRLGLNPGGGAGRGVDEAADEILEAASGPGGEVWLEPEGRQMAAQAILEPRVVDRQLAPLRDRLLHEARGTKPAAERTWTKWRVEVARHCTLRCGHCPRRGTEEERVEEDAPFLSDAAWAALRPLLGEVGEVSFRGGGDPLVHPRLADWIHEAREAGARASVRTNGAGLDDATIDRLLDVRTDWIELTLGGARPDTFRATRPGLSFESFVANVRRLTSRQFDGSPEVTFRFVLVREARDEVEDVIRLAADLGVEKVEFLACDVVREIDSGRPSLFGGSADPEIRALEKQLRKARKTAKRLGVATHASSFVPEEQAVCVFDPRRSLFVRHDGVVAPCVNLGLGGKTCFLGTSVTMPTSPYGRVPQTDLLDLWRSETSRSYRDVFAARVKAQEEVMSLVTYERSLRRLEETVEAAREAMPPAPEGCRSCRYLYNL